MEKKIPSFQDNSKYMSKIGRKNEEEIVSLTIFKLLAISIIKLLTTTHMYHYFK